jgi:hypothetical protein
VPAKKDITAIQHAFFKLAGITGLAPHDENNSCGIGFIYICLNLSFYV